SGASSSATRMRISHTWRDRFFEGVWKVCRERSGVSTRANEDVLKSHGWEADEAAAGVELAVDGSFVGAVAGGEPAGLASASVGGCKTAISTRRLRPRPSGLSLEATG